MAITRRLFLGALSALPFSGLARVATARVRPDRIMINRFSVAGFRYHQGGRVIRSLRKGDVLTLVAEPDNPHDDFAVEIYSDRIKLGYVPRSDNRHISRLLRNGAEVACEVHRAAPFGEPWKALQVEVYVRQGATPC